MKTKKRIGRRKADAACAAVAVVPDVDLVKFADGVERVVDGWRCVDVDAFRAALALRGAGDNLILAYVRKLKLEICRYALEWGYLVGHVSPLLEVWQRSGLELKAWLNEYVEFVASETKENADYLRLQNNSCTTLQGLLRRVCETAFDKLLCVPMMTQGESGARILDIDELLPGASKGCNRVFCDTAFAKAGVKGGKTQDVLFGMIAKWFVALIDVLQDIGRAIRYDRLNAAIEDAVTLGLEGLPGLFAQGRMIPHSELESAILKAKCLLGSVYREIAAGMAGAKGGAPCDKVQQGKTLCNEKGAKGKAAAKQGKVSDEDIKGVLSNADLKLVCIWREFRKGWGLDRPVKRKANYQDCWRARKGDALVKNGRGEVVQTLGDRFKDALSFERHMVNMRKCAVRKIRKRHKTA